MNQLPEPFILIGDFNGHRTLWGNNDTNSRGRQIEQLISDHCLCLLNKDQTTYFHEPSRTFHSLDLAICSPSLYPLLSFDVGSDLCGSDHFPLLLSYAENSVCVTERPRSYIFQRADWSKFSELAEITDTMVQTASINDAVQIVTESILRAADASIPKSSSRPRRLRRPWWNDACRDAYKRQKKLWDRFRRYPTTANLIAFKGAKAFARRVRRQSQRESFIRYVSSITSFTSSKELWRKVKAVNGLYQDFTLPILRIGTTVFSSPEHIAHVLGHSFAKVSSSDSYSSAFKVIRDRAEKTPIFFYSEQHCSYNCDFKMFELKKALSQCRNTSPRPDGIAYCMLNHLNDDSLFNILQLFNRIWKEGIYPTKWREAIVIPILKPGKDSADPMSYRPIALTSCLSKTLERMVNARLASMPVYVLETSNFLPIQQSGFRKKRSTIDNAVYLETQVRNAFLRRTHLVSVFFDIEKAYDRTWRYGILKTLANFGFCGNLPIFIQNFLLLRSFKVRIGCTLSDSFIQSEGVPQGSVLSVTLFILHISNILLNLPQSVQGTLYVDDLQISCQGSSMHLIERQLQIAINNILTWCTHNGHTISPSKSCVVHFCRKRGLHPDPDLYIGNQLIPVVNEVRFLGIIFDRKLTFLSHIRYLRKRCERLLNILKVLSNTSWGADRTSLLRIYESVILSRIDYGCVVYGSACASNLKKIDPLHHSALRICSGAFRTSPIDSLYVECFQMPLSLRRQKLSINYYFKVMSVSNHLLSSQHVSRALTRLYNARPSKIPPFLDRTPLRGSPSLGGYGCPNPEVPRDLFFSQGVYCLW
ncbi:putative RNA-directed DNA polymerase from transposon X-element [Araneus ventricosus]|uniref:Putative RNA-directed DNA polymerase from transposon X-element n=1 Tax=Araneus ventricosus TaxID=182803 RepID=A0A4Y2BSC8_ARAVE|nr:putative RNA-directed DNA polymerase from transposon X-element [Araneus ventricosus]